MRAYDHGRVEIVGLRLCSSRPKHCLWCRDSNVNLVMETGLELPSSRQCIVSRWEMCASSLLSPKYTTAWNHDVVSSISVEISEGSWGFILLSVSLSLSIFLFLCVFDWEGRIRSCMTEWPTRLINLHRLATTTIYYCLLLLRLSPVASVPTIIIDYYWYYLLFVTDYT